jgi:signal transduction histidine kinase
MPASGAPCYLIFVESIQLSAFYQSVTNWPSNEAELSAIAEKVCRLLDAPFAAIHRVDGAGKTAFKFCGSSSVAANSDVVDEFVRRRIHQAEPLFSGASGAGAQVKQIQISGDDRPWQTTPNISHLAIANISGENRPSVSGNRASRQRIDYGWLVVGTPKPLGPKDEVLLLAAAQHLASLAEIAQYEAGIQLRNQFLSIASHELKTPLTSIYGVLQLQERMLRMKKDEPPQVTQERQESYLKMVIRQTQRLNELIDGLLDVSRIQNGRFMVEPSDTDVAALVRETVNGRLAVIAQEAGVKLIVEAPESLHAWVDPVRMEEVITNLVMNAIRFSPEGGVVWIRLRDDNGIMRLTIRDQGPSVPVEDRERIFQPFERAQRTARFGGLGLGLFISRQIAQLHGGNVNLVESLPGKGNVFEASFPTRASGVMTA